MEYKFDWDDITIIPEIQSDIESRKDVNPYYKSGNRFLPIITAPMIGIVDENNFEKFIHSGCLVTVPRGVNIKMIDREYNRFVFDNYIFDSYGLCDFEGKQHKHTIDDILEKDIKNICIDIANGHMKKLIYIIHAIKNDIPDLNIMVGNIANPNTFKELSLAGATHIRVGIGSGNACLSSQQTSIHYPMASLIKEISDIKKENHLDTQIIADGGMRKYSDIIKALALGADLVMIGSIFNKTVEASAKTRLWKIFPVPKFTHKWLFKRGFKLRHLFFGMSTKLAQSMWGNKQMKTSEGTVTYQKVEYTISQWTENFEDYLRSAMSYTNSKDLDSFKISSYILITQNALNRFKK